MATKKRRVWHSDKYERDIENIIADYIRETGDHDWNRDKVAVWAIRKGRWNHAPDDAAKQLAKLISKVARQVTIRDDEGNEVRKYHSWRLGFDQPTFWSPIETIAPQNMTQSINARREKLVNGAVRAIVDVNYYNAKYNPGDDIPFETDLTKDVKEKMAPGLYDDVPPLEDE